MNQNHPTTSTDTATLNREYVNLLRATACPAPTVTDESNSGGVFTVVGVWVDDEPTPVGVIARRRDVSGGIDERFPQGVWATAVGDDDRDAEQAAVAVPREHDQ